MYPILFNLTLNFPLLCQASTIARCYPSVPENGKEPEDDESVGNVKVNVKVVEDIDATEDEEEKENKKMKLTVPKPLLPHAGEHSLMN